MIFNWILMLLFGLPEDDEPVIPTSPPRFRLRR